MMPCDRSFIRRAATTLLAALFCASVGARASAADQVYFGATDNITDVLVQKINAETVRVDMSCWYLTEHAISIALINKYKSGVPVRLIGDRGSIFEIDRLTKNEFYWLTNQGLPIRLRFNPTWYPEIDHWKATIFVGQNVVAFGSANYTPFELAPSSATNYKDESVLFTDDTSIVNAFKTKYDRLWNDTTAEPESLVPSPPYFKDWNDACVAEPTGCDYFTLNPAPAPMTISTARLEPDNPLPADLIWGQGPAFNNRLVQEINSEPTFLQFVIYRLTVDNITDALLAKFRSGVPMQLLIEPTEYLNRKWPEFWLTHANIDKLWAAGVPIKSRTHDGLTHMKTLVTSTYATNASSNYAAAWQRDVDYFISASAKPTIYQAIKNRVTAMWNDTTAFAAFQPQPPDAPTQVSPAANASGVPTTPSLVWNIAAFAVSYDVYLGTSQTNMPLVGNVPAQLVNNPPPTYTWTPTTALQPATTYFWKAVARTNATPLDPSLVGASSIWAFTTAGLAGPPSAPGTPSPSDAATGVSVSSSLSWSATGATTYDVKFGTTNPPPQVVTGQAGTSYAPALTAGTTYFWQIVATNSAGATAGPIWSFATAGLAGPPSAPGTPSPSDAATGVSVSSSLSWSATGATTYDVKFGTTNSPPQVVTGQAGTSYAPALTAGTTYFWQIVATNTAGATAGPIWSFATAAAPPPPVREVVVYATDIPTVNLHGTWTTATDASSPTGIQLVTPDNGWATTAAPLAAPSDYVDITFSADANTPYALWLRMQALNNSKYNDSVWVQYSDAVSGGAPLYALNSTSALCVNLATDNGASSLNDWGWQNGAYWLAQPTTVTFATGGTHTIRIQVREDGVQFDQIVLSSAHYLTSAPGSVTNDATIVPKP